MLVATSIVLCVTAAANAAIAIADLLRAEFVLANSAEVGVPQRWLPALAALKAAGAGGILLWFAHVPAIPVLAGVGLVAFYLTAIAVHVRTGVLHNLAFPSAYLALAVASLWLILAA
ncbi:DoxX family protein [Microbacterium sp. KNMS]